ncbi:hypothetical protein MKW92_025815 [Papaver armeniacum]|nr:hypothetical protein MKW92_025815 [Papaver armeniacum]
MVDAVVSFAVEKLGNALIGESFFLLGVHSQVEGLRDELMRMQCFLKDADAKEQQGDEGVRNWVKEIRNIAYDAEDVIDTFIVKVDATCKTKGIRNFLKRKALMVKNLVHLYRVGNEILAIQTRLKAISDSRITYGIKDLRDNEASGSQTSQRIMQQSLRNRYPHVEDNDVTGFEEHTKTLLFELMKDEEERRVVSIIGVGGLGKTTLAKIIYRHDTINSHFDCCGWTSISQQLNVKDSLGEITKKCMNLSDDELEKIKLLNETDLIEKIYIHLRDKRYFIVLDDVWKLDHWKSLSPAFPNGKRGSKVLLTTRNKKVASQIDPWGLHFQPHLLTDEESWELLCKKAFPRSIVNVGCYPAGLEKLGREMARKCGGLPLGICVLGGLLATKKSEIKEWELVHKDVIAYINKSENGRVNAILALSYHDLPPHLKPCFLYLALFPEDYAIPRKKLIQLWIAEGFIPRTEEKLLVTMEDIGKHQYFAELAQRCMIQLGKEIILEEGKIGSICRMHDLMRDLCLSKAKEINFLNIYDLQQHTGSIMASHVTTDACRRLRRFATHLNNADESERYGIYFNRSDCAIRTLFVVVPCCSRGFPLAPINYKNIKLLRVLDLGNVGRYETNITKEVSKLIHLSYLNLGDLSGSFVSPSIGNLRNLQTLKLTKYKGHLPDTTSKLVQLRHLNLSLGSVDKKFQIENLINLQTVDSIRAGNWIRKGCLEKLSKLRKLSVCYTSRFQTGIIVNEVVGKRSLLSLSDVQYQIPIRNLCIDSIEKLPNLIFVSLSCCHNLHTLMLRGKLDVLNLHKYPRNLRKLILFSSMLKDDPMATLQYLPNLMTLILERAYEGEEMVCSMEGFPLLENLIICENKKLKEWRVDQGGMSRLKNLTVIKCKKLCMLPEGLRFITTLEQLYILDMPLVKDRVIKGVGEDWYKVQHVPSITVKDEDE